MSDTPSRLLRLLSLLQTPREWPGSELSARTGVSARTVRRDIDRLRELGYPVEATMGAAGGYRLTSGAAMPPLILDDEEAVAIAVGLRAAAGQAIEGIEEASVRALTKLEQVLPSRLRYRVRSLGKSTVQLSAPGPKVDPGILTVLAAAIANHERVRFRYQSAASAEAGRHVDPERLVAAGRRWYLVAWDHDRADWRSFRADRITEAHGTGARATPRQLPAENAAAFLKERMYALAPVFAADVTLHMPAEQAEGILGTEQGQIAALDHATCRLRGMTDTLEWLATRLATLGCEFDVHGPPELIDHIRTLAARFERSVRDKS
jgi:predicted DNA-binding transcriptional regulator YafY